MSEYRKKTPSPRMGPNRGRGGEKPKDFKKAMKKVIEFSQKYKGLVILAIICALVGSIFTLVGPSKLKEITQLITTGMMNPSGIAIEKVKNIGITLGILYVTGYLLSVSQGFIMAIVTSKITKKMRGDIVSKISKLPMKYFSNSTVGELLSTITNDVDTLSQSLNMSVGTLTSATTLFLGSLVMMLITNVPLAITAVVSTILGFALMMIIMKKSQKYFNNQQQNLAGLNAHIEEMYTAHTIVKAYNLEEKSINEFNDINNKLKNSAFKAQSLSGLMMPIMMFIGNFGYVMVCIVGAVLIYNKQIDFGVIVAFMLYIRYFTNPLSQIAQAMQSLQQAAASSERIFDFLNEEEMPVEEFIENYKEKFEGDVEFKKVSFSYDKKKPIIQDFSLKVTKGQKVAIVGPTGAGKTTIVNLLMRFYEIDGGDIILDDTNSKELKRDNVHNAFCMVLQDAWIFEGSLRENLVYSNTEITTDMLDRVCKEVGLDHFVKTLPQGYETYLNDKVNLSGGQRQQITIARAMLANKQILILDEATSSVDTRTELHIQKAMDSLMKDKTSFVIAHRLSTIKNADVIIVMDEGKIIEQGTHKKLLEKNGFYANLYNSQFDDKKINTKL